MGKILAGQKVTAAALNALPADLATLTTGSVANSITETTIGTYSAGIAANDAAVNGGYEFLAFGTWDMTATPTIRFRLYVGSVATGNRIVDSGAFTGTGASTADPWWIRAWILVTATGAGGTFEGGGLVSISNVSGGANPVSSNFTAHTINTTVANDILLTAQFGTANAANIARTLTGVMTRT